MMSCILIRILPGKGNEVLESVKKFPEVKSAYFVFGRYDIVAFAEASTFEALSKVISKINAISGIKSTESLMETAQ
ncbi:MAG: Lrp/AsnC ligand binding domain-containing protein [Nitrososphaerota archaeon]